MKALIILLVLALVLGLAASPVYAGKGQEKKDSEEAAEKSPPGQEKAQETKEPRHKDGEDPCVAQGKCGQGDHGKGNPVNGSEHANEHAWKGEVDPVSPKETPTKEPRPAEPTPGPTKEPTPEPTTTPEPVPTEERHPISVVIPELPTATPEAEPTACKVVCVGDTPEVFPAGWVPANGEGSKLAEAHGYLEYPVSKGQGITVFFWSPATGHGPYAPYKEVWCTDGVSNHTVVEPPPQYYEAVAQFFATPY